MIRISVTDLESYRYWRAGEDPSLADLLVRLRHQEAPTFKMESGQAFAKLFENAGPGWIDFERIDGWTFDFSELTVGIALPPLRELKAEVVFETEYGPVTLVGKVDGLNGREVHDQKLTENIDAERYFDSLQWRCYLVMFEASTFVYDLFLGKYDEDEKRVTVVDFQPMTFYRYPDIRKDVERAVTELAGVIVKYAPDLVRPDAPVAAGAAL